MQITFYAGAADAAGTTTAELDEDGLTAAELLGRLSRGEDALAAVLGCCSLLVDGAPVREPDTRISRSARVDVLPPFAGG
ncbi:MAG: MoaD/ThiS family protein [Actinobacteria bacterium]|uniref:MoaD/ThiS family protein n=1 Tax=Propionicimonas sp. T2.31MG-18 TaxID=3157620 RepID=UPI0035E5AC09|nr:MoaD/ThiS family protein [Actinomycetota bacterium]